MKKILLSLVALNSALPQIYASENEKVLEAVDVVESEREMMQTTLQKSL